MTPQEYFGIIGATITLIAVSWFVVVILNHIGNKVIDYLNKRKKR